MTFDDLYYHPYFPLFVCVFFVFIFIWTRMGGGTKIIAVSFCILTFIFVSAFLGIRAGIGN